VKAKNRDMSVRELFRQRLGNAEIIPDASVSSKLMNRLARREFLRFNPARFNIYYLGGILVAGISVAIILSSRPQKSDQSPLQNIPAEISIQTDSTILINVPLNEKLIQPEDRLNIKRSESIEYEVIEKSKVTPEKEATPDNTLRKNNVVTPAGISDSFSKNGVFAEISSDKNQLHSEYKTEELLFEPSAKEGCLPLKILFSIKSDTYDSCRWTFGDGGYSYNNNPEWIFDVEGEYKVVLHLFGSDGSLKTSSTFITVYPKPTARFEISPENAVIPEEEIRLYNYSTNGVNFKWDFGDGNSSEIFEPTHQYSKTGNYNIRLVVSSEHGCYDSLVVMNALSGSEYFIEFPNAFIPNMQGPLGGYYSSKSDEIAQIFHPVSYGVSDFQLKIFSKLGIMIFETTDIDIGWDGYFKGQLCDPGVYIWKVRGNFLNGETFTRMGDVTILKN